MPDEALAGTEPFGNNQPENRTQNFSDDKDFGLNWIIEDLKGNCSSYEIDVSSLK